MTPTPILHVRTRLGPDDVDRVLALAEDAARVDGNHPLSEHVVLHLRHGDPDAVHLLVEDPGTAVLLGYAHLDISDQAEGPRAELAVSPDARRRGVGAQLIGALTEQAARYPGALSLWSHGTGAAAGRLAAAHGFHRVRRLWQLRRSLLAPLPEVDVPPGIALRPFDLERDADEWLALNARAFAELPDQAGWTADDLYRRVAEPWFDPAGFLLAHDETGRLVGFHWTKVHAHDSPRPGHAASATASGGAEGHVHDPVGEGHVHDPVGEVYVLGIDPDARGRGLGRALTLAGLHYLRGRGLSVAVLYVEAGNLAAIRLYRSLGFAEWDCDTLFSR